MSAMWIDQSRIAGDLCLRCLLFLGIAVCGETNETLDDLLRLDRCL